MKSVVRGGIAACALMVVCQLGEAAPEADDAVARAEFLYRVHCAVCHGSEGRGDGPVTKELRQRPSDLTRLRGEDGVFPAERVRRYIDGRQDVAGHGSREMPIWGLTFQQRSRPGEQEDEVAGRIDDLVHYLRSIQDDSED